MNGIVNQNNTIIIDYKYNYFQGNRIDGHLFILATNYSENTFDFYDSNGNLIITATTFPPFPIKQDGSLYVVSINNEKQFGIYNLLTKKFINDKKYNRILSSSFHDGFCKFQRGENEFYVDEGGKEYIK